MKRNVLVFFLTLGLLAPLSAWAEAPQKSDTKESAHGSYEWKFSWGGGFDIGVMFNELERWNQYLLEPSEREAFDTDIVNVYDLAFEVAPIEGLRLTAFGGYAGPHGQDASLNYYYMGLEPAFTARRGIFEFAAGAGFGYGGLDMSTGDHEGSGSLLVVRPFFETRWYPDDFVALHLRLAFHMLRLTDFEADTLTLTDEVGVGRLSDAGDLLSESGVYLGFGARFGSYPDHVKLVPDTDEDGMRDDVDSCPAKAEDFDEFEDHDGCPEDDNDKDGILDDVDQCKLVAEDLDNWEDEDGCPEDNDDTDGDGILDSAEARPECITLAEDMDNFEDTDGCPDNDNDNDGVADANDRCRDQAGPATNLGCPRVLVKAANVEITEKIQFALGEATILPESDSLLEEIADVIKKNPRIKKIEIQGHTDHAGKKKKNQKLSEERAKSVYDRLVELGVEPERLTYKGFGQTQPLVPLPADGKETEEGAAQNRRVEFLILEQEELVKEVDDQVKPKKPKGF